MRISDWSSDVCSSDLDHKSMDELRQLFGEFLDRAEIAVLNLDDPETARLAAALPPEVRRLTYGFTQGAGLRGGYVAEEPLAVRFEVKIGRASWRERVCQYV